MSRDAEQVTETKPLALNIAEDPELLGDFILESREHLSGIERNVLKLEQDAGDAEAIHASFRAFHTIKGLAGFLELGAVQEVAHEVETVLDLARNGKLVIDSSVIDRMLESKDYLILWLDQLDSMLREGTTRQGKAVTAPDNAALLVSIRALTAPAAAPRTQIVVDDASLARLSEAVTEASAPPAPVTAAAETAGKTGAPAAPSGREAPSAVSPVAPAAVSQAAPAVVSQAAPAVVSQAAPAAVPPAVPDEPAVAPKTAETHGREARAIKVDTGKLDYLVDMVGEMVIAQSLVRHDPDLAGETRPRLVRNLSQLARITDEVQRTAMSMRMVPVGQLFQKMSRLVRDLSRRNGKRVELETSGEDTELDRNIVEELADPLMHMVRNSLDHGVETPAEREAAGKSAVARVILRASHQAGHIVIEVGDDGRGLNKDRILKKALDRNLVEPGAQLTEHELFHLIFQPGFSTAEQVTDVSGRGVGMDVVRRQIHKLRGRIDIRSAAGAGTTFLLKVPLTLAIIDGLVVTVGRERYIVPLFAVREMVRPTAEMISTVQGRAEMALVRGSLLPMIRLYRRFGVKPANEDPTRCLLIVSEGAGRKFCLLVDGLIGKQEVVIKGMSEMLQGIEGVAGGAILGDGRVGLILDLEALCGETRTDKARG
jgi:two-component system, chemotaxis family, sensor kinase CheA